VARAREKVGFSEWKGRSAPESAVLGNNTAQLSCTARDVVVVMVLMGEASFRTGRRLLDGQ
jgi:hypothetical protein